MPDSYLDTAERVLLLTRRPMSAREILKFALLQHLLPDHLYGVTQHKTLQARLSEDISSSSERSRFFRTAPGIFFLKSLANQPATPRRFKVIHRALPRRKELKRDLVLTLRAETLLRGIEGDVSVPLSRIVECLESGSYTYTMWKNIKYPYIPVHSFSVVYRELMVLSYSAGKLTPSSDPICGKRSIGFGGAVCASDNDILYESFHGIVGSGINELAYNLGLPKRMAEQARYENHLRPFYAMVVQNRSSRVSSLHVVMSYSCPDNFIPATSSLSFRDLRWIETRIPLNNISQFDEVSQRLLSNGRIHEIVGEGSRR